MIRKETFTVDVETFASKRKTLLSKTDERLQPHVKDALRRVGLPSWQRPIVSEALDIFDETARTEVEEWGPDLDALRNEFERELTETLEKTKKVDREQFDGQVERITKWISTMTVNAGTEAATTTDPDPAVGLEWITMEDEKVRDIHKAAHGQQVTTGKPFTIGDSKLLYPGQPVGNPENWINCRCVVRPAMLDESAATITAAAVVDEEPVVVPPEEEAEPEGIPDDEAMIQVPFHGVAAPEGIASGDGRQFALGALTNRPLPLPLKSMFIDDEGHKGSVVAGRIDKIWRDGNLIKYEGMFDVSEAAYETVRLIADGMWRGISVDVDQAVGAALEDGSGVEYSAARIAAMTVCAIPAFAEAWIALGLWADEETEETPVTTGVTAALEFVSEGSWDGSASRFTPEQWKSSCILHVCDGLEKSCHKLPIKEPGGALSRAGVHAAASRIGQVDAPPDKIASAKSALRGAYKQLGEEPPESLAGETVEFAPENVPERTKDGPGWITHPNPTKDITSYWVRGPGAAKIRWGAGGDFNRCRAQLVKYVQNPEWLAGLCANLHYRALGIWPGRNAHAGEMVTMQMDEQAELPSVTLTASAGVSISADYFRNPELTRPTNLTVTDDGHVFGHIAAWDVCHIANPEGEDVCTLAPKSATDYNFFLTGEVITDSGRVPVGQISLGGGHADERLGLRAAMAHYDNTSTAVADITVGNDAHGIWFAGKLRDGVTDAQVHALRAAGKVSGDWRGVIVGGQNSLELIAALAVNVPGFPIPRASYAMDGDRQISLTAAGIPRPELDELSPEFIAQMDAYNARQARKAKLASLKDKGRALRAEIIRAKIEMTKEK